MLADDSILIISSKFDYFLDRIELLFYNNITTEWYQEGWIIALISAFSTALFITLIDLAKHFCKTEKDRKIVAFDIYHEIASVIFKVKKHRELNHNLIEEFKMAVNNNFQYNHPSLLGVKRGRSDAYQAHLRNLYLLTSKKDGTLIVKIKIFYDFLIDFDLSSEILSKSFEKFYAKNPTTSPQDIIERETGQYNDARLIILIGYDILAKIQSKYNVDPYLISRKKQREMNKKIFALSKDVIDDIQVEAENLKIDIIYLLVVIFKYNIYKNSINTGQYVKVKMNFFKKIRLLILNI